MKINLSAPPFTIKITGIHLLLLPPLPASAKQSRFGACGSLTATWRWWKVCRWLSVQLLLLLLLVKLINTRYPEDHDEWTGNIILFESTRRLRFLLIAPGDEMDLWAGQDKKTRCDDVGPSHLNYYCHRHSVLNSRTTYNFVSPFFSLCYCCGWPRNLRIKTFKVMTWSVGWMGRIGK